MLDLAPIFEPFRPALGNYNYWLAPKLAADAKIATAANYLDSVYLKEVIRERADKLGTTNLKVAASDWQLYYNRAVLPAVLLAMTLGGVGVEADITKSKLVLEENIPYSLLLDNSTSIVLYPSRQHPQLTQLQLPQTKVETVEELQQKVFKALFQNHLSPLFRALREATNIGQNILWGNAAYSCFSLYTFLKEKSVQPEACRQDSAALLERAANPAIAPAKNPLYQPVYSIELKQPGLPESVQVRRTCCLFYELPGFGKCTNCPRLSTPERIARWQAATKK